LVETTLAACGGYDVLRSCTLQSSINQFNSNPVAREPDSKWYASWNNR